MSIQVTHLSRNYGQHKAVNDISFLVEPGEIVGFLGPNGAGKSTTMKIMTGFLPPTSGKALICGLDILEHPTVRKRIGYLPEHNPLYLDMYVHEFLRFSGSTYGMKGLALRKRVVEIIALCGLWDEQNKKIENLSKGYRQRVGLAQALIHNPEVLILDEPTTGLDPNQIVEIRQLIRTISVDKTVIFSTHIMQEVEAVCDRAVVINKGELVADSSVKELLKNSAGAGVYIVDFDERVDTAQLLTIPGVKNVEIISEKSYRIISDENLDLRPEIFRFAADQRLSMLGLRQEEHSLESVFRQLTQKQPSA